MPMMCFRGDDESVDDPPIGYDDLRRYRELVAAVRNYKEACQRPPLAETCIRKQQAYSTMIAAYERCPS